MFVLMLMSYILIPTLRYRQNSFLSEHVKAVLFLTGSIKPVAMKIQGLGSYCHLKGQENYNVMTAFPHRCIYWRQGSHVHLLHAFMRKH